MKWAFLVLFLPCQALAIEYSALKATLEKYVEINIDTEICAVHKNLDGYYEYGENKLVICSNNINKYYDNTKTDFESIYVNIMLHEAVHLAQDCICGIDNDKLVVIDNTRKVSSTLQEVIENSYPKNKWKLEVEAWSYWKSTAAIELVKKHCKKRKGI